MRVECTETLRLPRGGGKVVSEISLAQVQQLKVKKNAGHTTRNPTNNTNSAMIETQ